MIRSMETTTSFESLFASGVLTGGEGDVSLSTQFETSVSDYESTVSTLPGDELSRLVRDRLQDGMDVDPFVELGEKDPRTLAELCALSDRLETPPTDWLTLLPVLRLFRTETPSMDGVPEPFIPVSGDLLSPLASIYSRLLVYVWLDDCPPCDALKDRLESIFDGPRGVLLFAVYGPANREVLEGTYGVTAGPALLFMRDGGVDSRLYGDHMESVIENEVDRLLE